MNIAPPLTPADRFAQFVDLLCEMIAASGKNRTVPGSLLVLLWNRVSRAAARFAALAALATAGTRPSTRRTQGAAAHEAIDETLDGARDGAEPPPAVTLTPCEPRMPPSGMPDRLPGWLHRRAAWLVVLAPQTAVCGSRLQALLDDPDIKALAVASPPIARMLRSLCWMLGVDPGSLPPPPPRRRRVRVRPVAAAAVVAAPPIAPPLARVALWPYVKPPAGPRQPRRRRGTPKPEPGSWYLY